MISHVLVYGKEVLATTFHGEDESRDSRTGGKKTGLACFQSVTTGIVKRPVNRSLAVARNRVPELRITSLTAQRRWRVEVPDYSGVCCCPVGMTRAIFHQGVNGG